MVNEIKKKFENQLNDLIYDFRKKKKKYYDRYFTLSFSIAIISAGIAFCLGISFIEGVEKLFKVISLVLSAILSVLTASMSFLNYKSKYIQRTKTLVRLLSLKRQYQLHSPNMTDDLLYEFSDKLETIMQEDLDNWEETIPSDIDAS